MSDLPVAIVGFTFVVVLLALGTGLAVTVVGLPLLADSWWAVLGLSVLGGLLLVTAPSVVHPMTAASGHLVRGLLGPTRASQRIRDLERTRGRAVDDSAAALRRIERDLHDGAQARLVTVALDLGLAKETLDAAAVAEHRPDVAVVDVRMPPTNTDDGLHRARPRGGLPAAASQPASTSASAS
jgi:CheY-like chemotaxis protein